MKETYQKIFILGLYCHLGTIGFEVKEKVSAAIIFSKVWDFEILRDDCNYHRA